MKYQSQGKQLTIDDFRSSLEHLPKSNRWIRMGDELPWGEIEKIYNSKLNNVNTGAGNKPARLVVGALIIKHKMCLSDQETIWAIQENPYMQYLLGLSEFTDQPVFDPSLFVTIRKRLDIKDLTLFTKESVKISQDNRKSKVDKDDDSSPDDDFTDGQGRLHKGDLKIDATCSDAEIRYPTDIDLLNDGTRVLNRYIDKLCTKFDLLHPITFAKQSRKVFLEVIKRKRKSKRLIKDAKSKMLTYLYRDIQSFTHLIAIHGSQLLDGLKCSEKRTLRAIIHVYYQQNEMFKQDFHSCKDRIISIFQPHIRPIVRGKSKAPTEFGAKMGVSITYGYTFIDHHSWNAYNESQDLELQIELYQKRFGYLPRRVFADKIYLNRVNRNIMKELDIEVMGKPLGRPPKNQAPEHQIKMAKSVSQRNEIEATFGTGKRVYRANNIRAKLPNTANCWTGMCYFVKNVMKFLKELLWLLTFLIDLLENQSIISRLSKGRVGKLNNAIVG